MSTQKSHKSTYTTSDRTNPEISAERDALNFVRDVRPARSSKRGLMGRFNLSMPVKISAIALIFAGVVLSVWTMKSSRSFIDDDDLPMIANDFGADSFKVAPGEDDSIQAPHSDKEFYSELEPTPSTAPNEEFRATPEMPSNQISQAALAKEEGESDVSQPSKIETKGASSQETDRPTVNVVETANKTPETYKAPAPTVSSQPRKTLQMAINETQQDIHKTAKNLAHDRDLSKTQGSALATLPVTPKEAPKAAVTTSPLKIVETPTPNAQKIYWVQIASLPTQAAAQKEWSRLQGKASAILKGQNHRSVRVDLGKPKGIRYRVHVGPFTKAQAIQKCQNLKNSQMGCLVIKKK